MMSLDVLFSLSNTPKAPKVGMKHRKDANSHMREAVTTSILSFLLKKNDSNG